MHDSSNESVEDNLFDSNQSEFIVKSQYKYALLLKKLGIPQHQQHQFLIDINTMVQMGLNRYFAQIDNNSESDIK